MIPAPRTETVQAGPEVDATPRRHLGATLAFVAILAVIAAVLVPFLIGRGSDDQVAAPPPPAATTTPDPAETTPSPDTPIPPPAGYRLYRDPAGWSIAVPAGWTVGHRGTAVTFTKADRTLRVTERANPPADTYVAAQRLQPVIESATPGFDFIRIANVTFRGWPTTDLEYRADTARTHSLIRSTVPNQRQVFDISWTCLDREWAKDRALFDTAMATFDPGA